MSSAPFSLTLNRLPLYIARNDIYAGEIKTGPKEPNSVRAQLTLLVPNTKRYEELYQTQEGAPVQLGPFQVRMLLHCLACC